MSASGRDADQASEESVQSHGEVWLLEDDP